MTGTNVLESKTGADEAGNLVTGANVLESKTGVEVDGDLVTGTSVLKSVFSQISNQSFNVSDIGYQTHKTILVPQFWIRYNSFPLLF